MDSPNKDDDYESLPLSPWSRSEPDLLIPSQTRPTAPNSRNPKKRARASRRAPTTVLTTDTTNFRAMVQEFTGIPEPPFTSRTRFHLFPNPNPNTSSSSSYILHKPPPPPPSISNSTALSTQFFSSLSSSSSVSVLPPFPSTTSSLLLPSHYSNHTIPNNNSNIYQLSSHLGLLKHNNNINHNNLPLFRMGGFGVSHHVHGSTADTNTNVVGTGGGLVSANFVNNNNSEPSVSTTNNGDKGAAECDNVAARTQGMVESWINCSSH